MKIRAGRAVVSVPEPLRLLRLPTCASCRQVAPKCRCGYPKNPVYGGAK